MTRKEAKNELRPIKDMDADIKSVELEIERLMAIATKMTPTYDSDKVTTTEHNRIEDAIIKIDEYRTRLSKLVVDSIDYKSQCLAKIQQITPKSLQKFLIFYYFHGYTLEKISETIDRTPRWTYELFCMALDEYAKKS